MSPFQFTFLFVTTLFVIGLNLLSGFIYFFREGITRKRNLLIKRTLEKGYEENQQDVNLKNSLDSFWAFYIAPTPPQKFHQQNHVVINSYFLGIVFKLFVWGMNLYVVAHTLFWDLTDFEIPLIAFTILVVKGFYIFFIQPIFEYFAEMYQVDKGNIYLPGVHFFRKIIVILPDLYLLYVVYNLLSVAIHKAIG